MARTGPIFFGLVLTTAIAVVAYQLHQLPVAPFSIGTPARHPIDAMLIAIVIGLILRNTLRLPPVLGPGIKYAVLSIMPLGIVLMGAKLDFFDVVRTSGTALIISVLCVAAALTLTILICRRVGVGQKLGLLIAVGTAICGGTAIAVAAPVIEAEDNETAFAIATVTLFGMIAVFVLPLLGTAFGMSQLEFGVWAGTSVHATPQVVATGFAYGPQAGDIATIVKLVRVLLLAPVVVGLGVWYGRSKRRRQIAHVTKAATLRTLFPPFILGFVLLALANTLNVLPDFTLHLENSPLWQAQDLRVVLAKVVTWVSTFLLTIAMAGVGLGVDLRGLRTVGMKSLYVGLASSLILAAFSYALLSAVL
ncbi:MAG: putative sulfate exporter family transporter [Deltaproteobacteria bacterium]|nr:putative sulfate exporter family transporter [Deltaproteobacteria bacterium]